MQNQKKLIGLPLIKQLAKVEYSRCLIEYNPKTFYISNPNPSIMKIGYFCKIHFIYKLNRVILN